MDQQPPTTPPSDPVATPEPLPNVIASSEYLEPAHPRRKKIILAAVAALFILLSIGGFFGLQQYNAEKTRQQAAIEARRKAAQVAAYQRQGTIQEIEASFEPEFTQTNDQDTRLISNSGAALQSEATAAGFAGANNATGL